MVPLVLVGTVIGVTVLVNLPRAGAMLALGVFAPLYGGYSLVRRPGGAVINTGWAYVAGFVGGITSTLFGAGGRLTRFTFPTDRSRSRNFAPRLRWPRCSASAGASSPSP